MNGGIREKDLPERFASAEYQVLLVAEKYQTGFDQPLLHNRIQPLKEDTFILTREVVTQ